MKRCVVVVLPVISSLFAAGSATADVTVVAKESNTVPYSETVVSCTGETVELSGLVQERLMIFYDPLLGYHFNRITRGTFTGTSESGTRYVGNFVDKGTAYIYLPADGSPWAETFPFSFHLISTDGTQDLVVRVLEHITVDANNRIRGRFDVYISCP
jgi:hypothetical protein